MGDSLSYLDNLLVIFNAWFSSETTICCSAIHSALFSYTLCYVLYYRGIFCEVALLQTLCLCSTFPLARLNLYRFVFFGCSIQ